MQVEQEEILEIINKVTQASEVLNTIDDLNFSKIDEFPVNLISLFTRREHMQINSVIRLFEYEFQQKLELQGPLDSDYDSVDDTISIYFLLRDIIENIEIIYFMLLNKDTFVDSNLNYTDEYKYRLRILRGESKSKGFKIYKNDSKLKSPLENALYEKYNMFILEEDFEKVKDIKETCNNVIHKNGTEFINPVYLSYYSYMLDKLCDLLFVCRFNFKLLFLLQGYILASTDYIDALECGYPPEEGSQYWIAPVFSDYINDQFSEEEKQWLKAHNQNCMQL